jgi:hypothetical protein
MAAKGKRAGDEGLLDAVPAAPRHRASRWHWREWRDYLLYGRRPPPLPTYTGLVEKARKGKIGIACSGGGVRSAGFSLGGLQVLQEAKVLQASAYLAGVSGGSYIAAAFAMVHKTWPGQTRPDRGEPGWDDSDPALVDERNPPFFPGSPEEQYLRNRVSYMAPGTWGKLRLGLRVLLGMVWNLAFIALFLVTVGLPLGLLYGEIWPPLTHHLADSGVCDPPGCGFTPLGIPDGILWPVLIVAGVALLLGLVSMLALKSRLNWRDFTETLAIRLFLLAAVAAVLLIGLPVLLSLVRALGENRALSPDSGPLLVGTSGTAAVGAALLVHLRGQWAEAQRVATKLQDATKWYRGLGRRLRTALAYALAAVAGPVLMLAFVLFAMSALLNHPDAGERWLVCGLAAVLFVVLYRRADLTSWSLHPFYRRRLHSAFALKRVRQPGERPRIAARDCGEAVERDYEQLLMLSDFPRDRERTWPTLLVCAAANISDDAATPPGRTVTSFTFSSQTMGGPLVGAVDTAEFEQACDRRAKTAFTLPAAVAISGAALSPSMGKSTRRPLRFLLALANVRLGVWVPNPRRIGTFRDSSTVYPRPRPSYLLRELLGRNHINAPFVYVTDGGHYDNLGIVELVRRGCTEIYCFDASNDDFDALGDAVALVRSELEVEIEIDRRPLVPDKDTGFAERDCMCGTIAYPGDHAPAGKLYYARTVMTEGVPADVLAYHARNPRFPHDPTADQLYKDERFEAYRALGARAARSALDLSGRVKSGTQPAGNAPAGMSPA